MKKIVVNIGGMSCQHCVRAVESALKAVPGVISVQVELSNSRAILTCDESVFDIRHAEKVISDQGYDFLGIES
jgi:copper chaperone CopZ